MNCITHAHALIRAQRMSVSKSNQNSSDGNAVYTIRAVRCCLRMRMHPQYQYNAKTHDQTFTSHGYFFPYHLKQNEAA